MTEPSHTIRIHKAAPNGGDEQHCGVCGQYIKRVPGGAGPTWVHRDSGAVAAPNPPLLDYLFSVECKQAEDSVKTELELTCTRCGEHLCDVEAGDTLGSLVGVAQDHQTTCGTAKEGSTP